MTPEHPAEKGLDLDRLRAETPGCAERIHLNNSGSSLMPRPVIDAIVEHVELEGRIGGYEAAAVAAEAIESAYAAVAELLGTRPGNVAFTEHATTAFTQALSSVHFESGDVILTSRADYVSNQIQYLALADRFGVEVVRAPDAPEGGVDVSAIRKLIHRKRPRLVAVTHIPTNSGLVQDVAAIGEACREKEILYLVDACQSVGQMPVAVEDVACDFLSVTARKFLRGPRGAGFLYVSDRALDMGLEPLFPDLRGADWIAEDLYQPAPDARRFETWEFAWALVLGTGESARYALDVGMEPARQRAWALAARLRDGLAALDGFRVLDRGPELCAIVTAALTGHRPAELVTALRERGINVNAQKRIDAVIDYDAKGVEAALRMAPHYFNTESEVDTLLGALEELTAS